MMEDIWRAVVTVWGISGAILIALQLMGSVLFDARETALERLQRKRKAPRTTARNPAVTVLIPTYNNAGSVVGCLERVAESGYPNMNIVVIDGHSADGTARVVRQYVRRTSAKTIRLIAKRTPLTGLRQILNDAREHMSGEFVLLLNPHALLGKGSVDAAVHEFALHPMAEVILPERQLQTPGSTAGVFEHYLHLLTRRPRKLRSVLGLPQVQESECLFFRREVSARLQAMEPAGSGASSSKVPALSARLLYAPDVDVALPSVQSLWQLLARQSNLQQSRMYLALRWHSARSPLIRAARFGFEVASVLFAVLTPFVIGYFIYLSLGLRQPTLLLATWLVLVLLLVSAVLTEEHSPTRQKLAYLVGMPVSFGFFLIYSCLPVVTLVTIAASFFRHPAKRLHDGFAGLLRPSAKSPA